MPQPKPAPPQWSPLDKQHQYAFDLEQVAGQLQIEGAAHGLRSFRSKRTKYEWLQPRLWALHSYRLLARNEWLGQGDDLPMRGQIQDHYPTITWPAVPQHRVQTSARYLLAPPNAVDVELTFRFEAAFADYEAFWSHYFTPGNQPYAFPSRPYAKAGPAAAQMLPLMEAPLYKGCYLSFPRDIRAASLLCDGRWEKGKYSPVLWAKTRYLGLPMVLFARPQGDEACVVMADPRTCFALGTVYKSDDPKDSVANHHSVYASLLGHDVKPGDVVRSRLSLALIRWTGKEDEPRAEYAKFLERCQG